MAARGKKRAGEYPVHRREALREARFCIQRARYFIGLAVNTQIGRPSDWRLSAAMSWASAVAWLVDADGWRGKARLPR
jgi:hypothetical protein